MAPAAAEVMQETVGKKRLAEILGWSRPTLDQRLRTDPNFPVVRYGTQTGGWAFDPAAVRAYMQGAAVRATVQPEAEPVASIPSGPAAVRHRGEATARQKRDLLQAAILADRLKLSRGDLLVRADVAQVLGEEMAVLAAFLNALADVVVRTLNLPQDLRIPMQALIDTERRRFIDSVTRRLSMRAPQRDTPSGVAQ